MASLALTAALLVSCRTATASASTSERPLDLDQLDAQVLSAMSKMEIPGLALAIVDEQGVVVAKGYGVRALASGTPVDADTLFDIGSVTKTFTATAVALLVDEGRLGWSTTIREHIPDFALDSDFVTREFTLADALSHRGGYVDNYFYDLFPGMSRSELLRRLSHSRSAHPFRTAFEYNNALFQLAGEVIPVVTGRGWSGYVSEHILTPLGMRATLTERSALESLANRATPHFLKKDGMAPVTESLTRGADVLPAAGAMLSSANDMAKWCRFQLQADRPTSVPFLREDTLHAMRTTQVSGVFDWFADWGYGRQRAGYGLGWQLFDYRDDADQHIAHGGATEGMQSWIVVSAKHDYCIAMMSNGGWAGDRVHFAIANWVHDRYLRLEPIDWTGDRLSGHRAEVDGAFEKGERRKPEDASIPPTLPLEAYAGSYDHPMYGPMVVRREGSALKVRLGILNATAEPWGGDTFYLDWGDVDWPDGVVRFDVRDGGVVNGLTYEDEWVFEFTRRANGR